MKVEIELPEIPGYEYTGEYRRPEINEFFWNKGEAIQCKYDFSSEYPILRKKRKLKIVIYQWLICNENTDGDLWDRGYRMINGTEDYISGLCSEFGYTFRKMSDTPIWIFDGDTL